MAWTDASIFQEAVDGCRDAQRFKKQKKAHQLSGREARNNEENQSNTVNEG